MRNLNPNTHNCYKNTIIGFTLLLVFIYFYLPFDFSQINWHYSSKFQEKNAKIKTISISGYSNNGIHTILEQRCDIFRGDWVPYTKGPYYTNESGCFIEDGENCMKFGRPDSDFMRWRWKPDECELPLFDASKFLELVSGKSMAFIGDSVARNHMQSLNCLLSSVARPIVKSNTGDTKIKRWVYPDYNFTLQLFSTTHLIQSGNIEVMSVKPIDLYLDEPDETWAKKIDSFEYVIISDGHWFSRPLTYYEDGKVVGCHMCNSNNMTDMSRYYGYLNAFRTAFRTILDSKSFKGTVILRTISPTHFEFEEWGGRGTCVRKKPFSKHEIGSDWYLEMFKMIQMEEFRQAKKEGDEKGIKFQILDITDAMRLRPDGHPNLYGYPPGKQAKGSDCLHWCLPGAIDLWNELLLEMLKRGK